MVNYPRKKTKVLAELSEISIAWEDEMAVNIANSVNSQIPRGGADPSSFAKEGVFMLNRRCRPVGPRRRFYLQKKD